MNSLKIKILGLLAVIMIGAISLITWYNLQTQQSLLQNIAEQNGRLLGQTVRNSIQTSMVSGENDRVRGILAEIGKDTTIESVEIFDESGRILISDREDEVGQLARTSDLLAFRTGRLHFREDRNGADVFNTIIPLENSKECYGCHQDDKKVLGILSLHISLKNLDALQIEGRNTTLYVSIAIFVLLIVSITIFILIYVDSPIRRLVTAMQRVEEGKFEQASLKISSSEEMAELADRFNGMVGRLKSLIDSTIKNECELAVHREKLAHHDEIQSMNITLEERLKEIEYLNITLEERIEEIEEANYKIADLASDLEIKNRSLEANLSRLGALNKMGLALNSVIEPEKLFDVLIRRSLEAISAKIGYILLIDHDNWCLRIGATVGLPEKPQLHTRIPIRQGGVSYWVIENRQPILIESLDKAVEFNKTSALGYRRESVICAPLQVKDEIIGTITIANKSDSQPFTADELEFLSTIAAQASVAIKNVRLYEDQQATYLSTVQALVSAVEASDPYTRGHSERVTRFAQILGRQIELPPDALKRLEHAAILHDIGKIGIDIALLHKTGELTSADVLALQQHPLIGSRILEPINFLDHVREIIVQHHERYDGCGYPLRVKGPEILLEARILAVADTYDAMTSDRPYRKALSHETALREIQTHAGTQFDPLVAEAMTTLCNNGLWPTC